MSKPQIHVMLVDDSAVIRGALTRVLEHDDEIKVTSSQINGEAAIKSAELLKPDVVILDIEMPVMDGLTALPKILEASPNSKVIMFSTLTAKGADVTMKALTLGAVECILKPDSTQSVGPGSEFQTQITGMIKGLVPPEKRRLDNTAKKPVYLASTTDNSFGLHDDRYSYQGKPSIIAVGSSTGGPNALFNVLKSFKDFDVPIIITQHMPATFTKILAQHINLHTGIDAVEGEEGMALENGKIYVAPGGKHMIFKSEAGKTVITLSDGEQVNFCKPAVDVMFDSALEIYGKKMLGVILTGMGADGLNGCKNLVEFGGRIIAQDEETSTVWGMPGAVAKAGICSKVLPLDEIGPWVKDQVLSGHLQTGTGR